MSILELLDGVIRKPANTFNVIAREKPVGWALLIFAFSTLLGLISTDYSVFEPLQISPTLYMAIQIIFSLAGLFIFTGLLHLLSRIFKGSGDYWGLFSTLGFAQFPGFLAPIAAIIKNVGGVAGAVLGGFISVASGIWVLVLYVIALRESRGISTGASVLTYVILLAIIVAVIVAGAMYLVFKLGMNS
ncbi:MAG TPA: YIP1 family protein [Firmicutes bacterium]|nr:YIP1 family protein [Bacillota bacterium]